MIARSLWYIVDGAQPVTAVTEAIIAFLSLQISRVKWAREKG